MDKDNIKGKMLSYDFTVPVTVTTIFEDSDEDANTVIKIEDESEDEIIGAGSKSDDEKKDKSITDSLQNYVNLNGISETNSKTDELEPKKKAIEVILAEIENSCKQYFNENNLQIKDNSRKRKLINPENSLEKKICKDLNSNQGRILSSNQSINPTMHPNATQPNTANVQKTVSSGHMNYVKSILNTLSEYLRLILDSYYCYAHARDKSNNNSETNQKKHEFMQMKHHLFNLSFVIIEKIIVPQLQNESFIKNFIQYTALRDGMRYNVENVYSLLKEMIEWSKLKQSYLKNITDKYRTGNNQQDNNAILKKHLAEPPKAINPTKSLTVSSINHKTKAVGNISNTIVSNRCIFSSGPPGREININVNESVLTRPINGQINNPIQSRQIPQDNNNSLHAVSSQAIYPHTNYLQVQNQSIVPQQNSYLNPLVYHNNQNNMQSNYRNMLPPYATAVNWQNSLDASSRNLSSSNSTNMAQAQPTQPLLNEFQLQHESRENIRSLSTDSGFMSPPPYNAAMDPNTQRNAAVQDRREHLAPNLSSSSDSALSLLLDWNNYS